MPTTQPAISALECSQRVYRAIATAGSVCRMITPPISCRSMENCGSMNRMNATAPNFTTSDAHFAWVASCFGVASLARYSL